MNDDDVVMAFLTLDGKVRQTCLGCSRLLAERGLVCESDSLVLPDGRHRAVGYALAEGITLEDCRKAIRYRHIGTPWGD